MPKMESLSTGLMKCLGLPCEHRLDDGVSNGLRKVALVGNPNVGKSGKIVYIHSHDSQKLQKLMSMGILPVMSLDFIRRFHSFVFQVEHSQFAVDSEMADEVYVRIEEP